MPSTLFYTHFNTPSLTIYEDTAAKLIVVNAHGVVPSAVYRKGMDTAVEVAIQKQLPYWLVDNKEGGIITTEDQIWAGEVLVPRIAYESSVRKMALVEPVDVHSKLILEDMMDKAQSIFDFEMQFFQEKEIAYIWFKDSLSTALL
ncbi:hypothetical protein SAMN04487941_3746 [Pontibacter akesuensis]|uniref:SpoIIAA-like n=2 Tax=Pontibacter akesuensis TaxID=388950 RepID=A0A1I7KHB4_9BACT|nr:hypothetical protein SAMN04487941_3746 [Pontibacter akesuensis]